MEHVYANTVSGHGPLFVSAPRGATDSGTRRGGRTRDGAAGDGRRLFTILGALTLLTVCDAAMAQPKTEQSAPGASNVKLITLDPGHYHASLVQIRMYDHVDSLVHVYAPAGADLDGHLKRIESFNTRPDNPTRWVEKVYTGPDYFERMLREKPGNLVVIAGNNTRKTQYILGCVKAGLNVLADKPMAITPEQFKLLLEAFKVAEANHVLLYDIMTERYPVTTMLQRELAMMPRVFGKLQEGTAEQPAIAMQSVHHFSKTVAGKPLTRPAWFFDVNQEGEGMVDVATHLVDLVQWEGFPDQILKPEDVKILSARRWSTPVTPAQFEKCTGLATYPAFLKKDMKDGELQVYGNGEINYTLKGHFAKVSVIWNYEPPPGGDDTHYSIMRGTKANLVIRQGKEQHYKPTLYVENKAGLSERDAQASASDDAFEQVLRTAIDKIHARYPGVTFKPVGWAVPPHERRVHPPATSSQTPDENSRWVNLASGDARTTHPTNWEIVIPDTLETNHEQHFGQVTDKYLGFLAAGRMPRWEVPNMIVKYHTIMEAYKVSR
jgi:predicted dehydrogenase